MESESKENNAMRSYEMENFRDVFASLSEEEKEKLSFTIDELCRLTYIYFKKVMKDDNL
jgi:hypothetical protein